MTSIPVPPDDPTHSSRKESWQRWVKIWHIVFYLSLVIPIGLVLWSGTMRQSIGLVVGLSLLLGGWYGVMMIWLLPKAQPKWQASVVILFLAGAFAIWFPLSRASWAYYLTVSSFYGMMWGTLPFGLALAGNIILTGLIIWSQALNLGRPVFFSTELWIISIMVLGWAALLALWIRSVMRESAARKQLIEQLEAAQRDLSVAERQAGILEERQRLAQEIHDTLAQGFTSIVMQLEAADSTLSEEQHAVRQRLQQARETARRSLAEARRLVQALRPEALEGSSLPEALARVAARWEQETGTQIDFSVTGNPRILPAEVEVSLLRLMQEGLANIQKHARATHAAVTLSYMEDQVALDVHDDGIGFDPEDLAHPADPGRGRYGLRILEERVSQLGGQLIIESNPGQGTTLAIQIPVEVHA